LAPRVVPLGDGAVMAELAGTLDLDANAAAHRIAADVRRNAPEWVVDVMPALVTVTVHFAAETATDAAAHRNGATRLLLEALEREGGTPAAAPGRTVEIPVCYELPHALDLAEIAALTGLSTAEVVRAHVESAHRVLMIGFVPGHPYIGGLDPRLAVPRRATPRPRSSGSRPRPTIRPLRRVCAPPRRSRFPRPLLRRCGRRLYSHIDSSVQQAAVSTHSLGGDRIFDGSRSAQSPARACRGIDFAGHALLGHVPDRDHAGPVVHSAGYVSGLAWFNRAHRTDHCH
jgi:KipI family sensor histidine kinase inhibitor